MLRNPHFTAAPPSQQPEPYPHATGPGGNFPRAAEAAPAESLASLEERRASAAAHPQSLEARRLAYLEGALANSHASSYDRSLAAAERGFRLTLLSCILGKTMIVATDIQKDRYAAQAKVHEHALASLRQEHEQALARARGAAGAEAAQEQSAPL